MPIVLTVDGREHSIDAPGDPALLFVLRNDLARNGPKLGCGAAHCGSCTVLVDGQPIRACVTPASAVAGMKIETLDGLAGPDGAAHPVQAAFLTEQAAQCGYCTAGVIMTAVAFLRTTPDPTDRQVREALDGHLCRCGSQNRAVRAVLRAAKGAA